MRKRYDILIVDLYNLYYRNYHVHKEKEEFKIKKDRGYLDVGGIFGSLVSIRKLRRECLKEDGYIIFLADNATSNLDRRKQIDPDYKSGREKKKESFYKYIEYLTSILRHFLDGEKVIRIENHEADDIAPVVIEIEDPCRDKEILVVSNDMDWSRLINYRGHSVDWFDGRKMMSESLFEDKYGFKPSERGIIIYKTFKGDESDFIPNAVKGLPIKYLKMFLDEKSVTDILNNLNLYDIPKKWKDRIQEASPRLVINEQLVDFLDVKKETVLINTHNCKYNKSILKSLFDNLNLEYSLHPTLAKDIRGEGKDFLQEWEKPIKRRRV